jgi:tetratricopeptide (TPR) repeat protein
MTFASEMDEGVSQFQKHWAVVNYEMEGSSQSAGFNKLMKEAKTLVSTYPQSAEPLICLGIAASSATTTENRIRALKLAKIAKRSFEHALKIDASALSGIGASYLGRLYHKVPPWPLGFGDEEKAKILLTQGVKLNPYGADSNYFMASFLYGEKEYKKALTFINRVLAFKVHQDYSLAEAGRRMELAQLKLKVEHHL